MTKKLSEMTPDQLKLYEIQRKKNKERMARSYLKKRLSPEFKERQALSNTKWREKTGYSKRHDVKKRNTQRMKLIYRSDQKYAEKEREYQRILRRDPASYKKKLDYQKAYQPIAKERRRLNVQLDHFMKQMELEPQDGRS